MNDALVQIQQELDQFVYSTSHDLRGPLTSTIGLVNLALKEGNLKEKNRYIMIFYQKLY